MEKINKLYKPAELEKAQHVLYDAAYAGERALTYNQCTEIIKYLYMLGWRIVKVTE